MLLCRVRKRYPHGERPDVHNLLADRFARGIDPHGEEVAFLVERKLFTAYLEFCCLQTDIIPGTEIVAEIAFLSPALSTRVRAGLEDLGVERSQRRNPCRRHG